MPRWSLLSQHEIDELHARLADLEREKATLYLRYSEAADDERDEIARLIDDLDDEITHLIEYIEDERG